MPVSRRNSTGSRSPAYASLTLPTTKVASSPAAANRFMTADPRGHGNAARTRALWSYPGRCLAVRAPRTGRRRMQMTDVGRAGAPLLVGLAGAGPWAEKAYAPMLQAGPETRLACVWARRAE